MAVFLVNQCTFSKLPNVTNDQQASPVVQQNGGTATTTAANTQVGADSQTTPTSMVNSNAVVGMGLSAASAPMSNICGLKFDSLLDLIHHIEDNHINEFEYQLMSTQSQSYNGHPHAHHPHSYPFPHLHHPNHYPHQPSIQQNLNIENARLQNIINGHWLPTSCVLRIFESTEKQLKKELVGTDSQINSPATPMFQQQHGHPHPSMTPHHIGPQPMTPQPMTPHQLAVQHHTPQSVTPQPMTPHQMAVHTPQSVTPQPMTPHQMVVQQHALQPMTPQPMTPHQMAPHPQQPMTPHPVQQMTPQPANMYQQQITVVNSHHPTLAPNMYHGCMHIPQQPQQLQPHAQQLQPQAQPQLQPQPQSQPQQITSQPNSQQITTQQQIQAQPASQTSQQNTQPQVSAAPPPASKPAPTIKPFKCSDCGRLYKTQKNFNIHLQSHNPKSRENPT